MRREYIVPKKITNKYSYPGFRLAQFKRHEATKVSNGGMEHKSDAVPMERTSPNNRVPQPSNEQQQIIDDVMNKVNVVGMACPGSGKTTLAMQIAASLPPERKVLLLTYNRALADTTSMRVRELHRDMVEDGKIPSRFGVYTYHGLLSSLSRQVVNNDVSFFECIESLEECVPEPHKWRLADFDLLIMDEAQDMRPLFWKLVKFLVTKVCHKPDDLNVMVVGDVNQMLYDFYADNSADTRFMTQASVLFGNVNTKPWVFRTLSTSFRLTTPIAKFVNTVFALTTPIQPRPNSIDAPPVILMVADVYKDTASLVASLLRQYDPQDVFILCPSLNERSPAVPLVNMLLSMGVHVHVGRSGTISDSCPQTLLSLTNQKVQTKTFHAGKGLESKCVVVINNKPLINPKLDCANFVAMTRSSEKLIIVQSYRHVTMSILNQLAVQLDDRTIDIRVYRKPPAQVTLRKERIVDEFCPNDMFAFVDVCQLVPLLPLFTVNTIREGITPCFSSNNDEDHEMDTILLVAEYQEQQISNYARTLVHSTRLSNGTNINTNVLGIVGNSLKIALNYLFTGRLPKIVYKLLMNHNNDTSLGRLTREAIKNIKTVREVGDDNVTFLQRRLPAFASISTCIDAITGYKEKLAVVNNFSFILQSAVFDRLERGVHNVQTLLERHRNGSVMFEAGIESRVSVRQASNEENADEEVKKIYLRGIAPILVPDELIINLVHKPTVGSTDFLETILMGDVAVVKEVYLVNLYDGAVFDVKLKVDYGTLMLKSIEAKTAEATKLSDREFTRKFTL